MTIIYAEVKNTTTSTLRRRPLIPPNESPNYSKEGYHPFTCNEKDKIDASPRSNSYTNVKTTSSQITIFEENWRKKILSCLYPPG
jgi:hypothetical protein